MSLKMEIHIYKYLKIEYTWVNVLNSVFDELFLDGKEKSSIIEQNPVINIICSLLISYQSL